MIILPLPIEGEQHVVRVEIAGRREVVDAGVELHAPAQHESDGLTAVGDVPLFGKAGDDLGRAALELNKLIEERPRGIKTRAGDIDRRREVLRTSLRAVDERLG